ncbi:unnamed protein product [Rotaria sordida]|uniref:Uncharacterized protein n=1 Tax=Rotaria sordida TaxID=392033 RepID=A0A818QMA6_9BILA|nr:unnamed protein product [Rotaria sordida]
MPHLSTMRQTTNVTADCPLLKVDTYGDALLRTLYSFKPPSSPMSLYACRQHRRSYPQSTTVSQSIVNELVNGSSDNQQSLADPSSLSSSSSSLFSSTSSSSSNNTSANYFTLEAHLPLVKNKVEKLEKFQRLLSRLDNAYNSNTNNNNNNNNQNMSTSALPPPSPIHITDRYVFRSPSNDKRVSRISPTTTTGTRKNKLSNNPKSSSSSTPPSARKRYKFSSVTTDQNNNNVYKFPNEQTELRSHSTDSDRYYFPSTDPTKQPQQTLTYIRSGNGLEPHTITFIEGKSSKIDKTSLPTSKSTQPTTIIPDTPYLFSKTKEPHPHSTLTSLVNPEDAWIKQRQQPQIIFDSTTDLSPSSQLKRPRTSSTSPEHRQTMKRSPTRMDTITSTNGSLSTLRRSPPTKIQNVRFDPSSTPRSYLDEARERLAGKKRGRSPQAFQQSVDRLVSSTNQKYLQQQILSPPISFQQQDYYISQYYAQEEPPIDYPMDSDDDEPQKRSLIYHRGLNTNRTHTQIMKNVNKSLIDGNYTADMNRIKQLDQNFHRYLRSLENQSLQRELNYDLIRCFSSTYLDDLRREENRHFQTRSNMRSYTYEDIQDIHMSPTLEAYKMKRAIDRERRLRLSTSFDGQITSSTPTSSIGAGLLSPLLSSYSPIMMGSLNENMDAQSGGFETDRRSQKSHTSTAQTPIPPRPGYVAPGANVDLFYEIMQDRFRGVDASIAGQVSNASQYTKQKLHHQPITISQIKPVDHDSDVDIRSNSSFWSDEEEEEEQIIDDNQRKTIPNQKQLARYLSTVNRSLLDRPSHLIADFYISKLNRSMKESVRNVETIARDKALMRQYRNREFIDETTSKLGRSLSAEHLYQVRKEHLRYRQPFTTPTSFTVEDVADIYKPFVLENYKRKIAIELERRRREKQGQLMAGIGSPPMYTSETTFSNAALKATQPPIIEVPIIPIVDRQHRPIKLTSTSTLRINEPIDNELIVVRPQVVQTQKIHTSRARRTLTDDGSADVVHHVGIIAPPPSYTTAKQRLTPKPTTITTKITEQYESRHILTVPPPDFADRTRVYVRKDRAQSNVVQPTSDDLIEGALSTSQQILFKDLDYDPNLQRAVQIITPAQATIVSPRSPTKIYTPSSNIEKIPIFHADRVESASGNHDLSMVNIKHVLTLNQGEINELTLLAQQAQRLQIPPNDYDHAMIILTPAQTQHQHSISPRPLLLAAANIDQLSDQQNEQVTRRIDEEIQRQRTQLIAPIAEHMAKVEQDIPVFENISIANIHQYSRNKLNEIAVDSGIVSLNTSQASEQPLILNASKMNRLDQYDEEHLENIHEDDYYRRRIRALDLLRQVEIDPNSNIRPVHADHLNIFENITNIPSSIFTTEQTKIIDHEQIDQIQTLQHTDEPVIYETLDQNLIDRTPNIEYLSSSHVEQDNQLTNRSKENLINWGNIIPIKQHQSIEKRLSDTIYEQTKPFIQSQFDQKENLQSKQEPIQHLETIKLKKDIIYNYGERNEIPLSRTSSFGSDKDLKIQSHDSAAIKYDHHHIVPLDGITQPLYHHPPVQTHHDQEQISVDIDEEPMAVQLETSWVTDVSHGRASFIDSVQTLNAPKTLTEPNLQALLLEELATATTALHEQRATPIIQSDDREKIFQKIEENNRIPVIVYDTDWKDENTKPISNEIQSNIQNAQEQYSTTHKYEQAKITKPKSILSRERYEHIENNNQEIIQQIGIKPIPRDRSIERIESKNKFEYSKKQDQKILCRPIDNHLDIHDEQISSLSDDSFLTQYQQKSHIDIDEPIILEKPLHSTSFLTLNYPYQNQELNRPWQRVFDQQFSDQYQHLQQQLRIHTEQPLQLSDRSLLTYHQPKSILLEKSLHSIPLNYAQYNQELDPSWQQVVDRNFFDSYENLPQHLQIQTEKPSKLSDSSLVTRHQPESNIYVAEPIIPEASFCSTAFLTLNYAHHNQEQSSSWEQVVDRQFSNQYQHLQQHVRYQSDQPSPRYLPLITPAANERIIKESDNYVSEFHQVPLLHENIRLKQCDKISLLPSTQINQSRPIYRVRQKQISTNDEYDYSVISSIHSNRIDRIDTISYEPMYFEKRPVMIDIEVRVRPKYSETSSIYDMESFLNRFEESLEPEQHLPLVDQISLSYATSIRSMHDSTQRAIERYEKKYPFFNRSLPIEWLQPTILPHDEQFVEQLIVGKSLETMQQQKQQQVELKTNIECLDFVVAAAAATANDAYSIDERFEDEISNSLNIKNINNEQDNNSIAVAMVVSHCSPTSDYETDSLDKDNDTISTAASIGACHIHTTTPIMTTTTTILPSLSSETLSNIPVDYLLDTLVNEKKSPNNRTKDFLLTIDFDQYKDNHIHHAKVNELEQDTTTTNNNNNILLYNFNDYQQEFLNIFFEPEYFHLPIINEIIIYQINFHNQYSNFLLPIIHYDDNILSSNEYKITNEQEIFSIAQINYQYDYEEKEENLKNISYKYEQLSYIEHYYIQSLNPFSETLYVNIIEPPIIMENEDDHSTSSILPDLIPSSSSTTTTTTTIIKQNEEYIEHGPKEVNILPTSPSIQPTPLHPSFDSPDRARQTIQTNDLEHLPEQEYITIRSATPTPSMRIVRPSRPGPFIEQPRMTETIDFQTDQSTRIPYTRETHNLHYAATTLRDQSDHLPPKHLPVAHIPDFERARIVSSSTVPFDNLNKTEVLVRDTIVQHVSEDEKSTSSEEVIFEEWSEEYRCRRIDEYDKKTNQLLRSTIDQTGDRVKSDVIKEEYKEKNERIKGHKSYDVIKEVYRRVPAHTIDPTKTTIVSIECSQSPVYEEISPQPPPSSTIRTTTSSSPGRQIISEITPRDRHWSSEDLYTTEIVYDSKLARDIESIANAERFNTKFDSTTPPSSSTATIYDRVRPGQYIPIPSTSQTITSRVPSSTYDHITNIVTPSTYISDRRQQQQQQQQHEGTVSEEYHVEVKQQQQQYADRHIPSNQYQTSIISPQQQRHELSEDDISDQYGTTGDRSYYDLSTIITEAGQKRDSDWRSKLKQIYTATSDDDQFDQFGKSIDGNYTAQRVTIVPTNIQQQFKDTSINLSGYDKTLFEQNKLKTSPPLRHAVKEILVCVSRESSPDKQFHQQIYHLHSSSDEDEQKNKRLVLVDGIRSRETIKKITSTSRTGDDRPQPPKRSSSSSSIIDERRSRFEQQRFDSTNDLVVNRTDRPTYSRVGVLRNTFESPTNGNIKDDLSKFKTPVSTSFTEQRRRIFEEQDQINKGWASTDRRSQQLTPTIVVPQRRVYRISGRRQTSLIDDFDSNERRVSETYTAPSRVTEHISRIESTDSKSTSRIQSTDRLSSAGFDTMKSSLEPSMIKTTERLTVPQTSTDLIIKDKRIISSIDSDVSGASPPIYQSTPKSIKQKLDEDAGHESEDELSDPTNKQQQQYDIRRRTPKTRLRDFSQSTTQPFDDITYISQRTKSAFNETNMENILSHVPTSKGKGLLIELSPHISHEVPITSTTTTKPIRDPQKYIMGSDSGIFEYSTATSQRLPTSSSSWRNNATSSIIDDVNRTQTTRDSGIYGDSISGTLSSRYGRRQTSDTDQTTIHGGDDSVSRSTYKYDTEIISNDQFNQQKQQQQQQQQQQRNIRRQVTSTPPSDYENIANYHSGQRKIPITTQTRTIMTKPLVVDEIETIETETRVECQVQRTHEIKESTTKTEQTGNSNTPKKIITTTTTTTTTTGAPIVRSPEYSSDEASRTIAPSKRILLNDRTYYYDSTKSNASPPESTYTPTTEIRQQTQIYRENGFHQHRYDSPQSDSISYPIPPPPPPLATTTTTTTTLIQEEEPVRIEETWFKPIQRDRSQDSLLQGSSSRSNIRTLSSGPPRTMEITSLSPQNQVTFGKYTPNEIIAIVRVPELSHGVGMKPSPSTIKHGTSEPELNARIRQEEEQQQRSKLHYERIHASSYRPSTINQDYQQRQSRSRISPYDTTNEYSSSLGAHARSSSYHSILHEQDRQQQLDQDQYSSSPYTQSAYRRQIKRRTGSLGNLLGPNIEFEIEIEKRPPQSPEQPTVVELDQSTRAIVTTSKDGRVSIQNVSARPGNTVVINSDFHSSDRSLNRSSGYFSADELRSQGLNTNYSSDEQSSGATGMNINQNSQSSNTPSTHTRRYKNNEQITSKLPSHYRTRQQNNYQQLNSDNFDKLNQIVHRYYRQSTNINPNNNKTGFNETIDQIDALYNNLDIHTNDNYIHDNKNPTTAYDFSKSRANRRQNLSQNSNEYSMRYSSTGFPYISNHENTTTTNSNLRHLVSPPVISNNDKRHNDTNRAYSDNENLNNNNEHNRNWGSTSLNDLVMATPNRPSQSLSSSGILADYATPGSISPSSGFGSTQNVILQQNRLNSQAQIVQRNRTSVKQVKQKSAAKKKIGNIQGQYSDEEDDNDSAGGHDSPLSDNGRPQPPTRFSTRYQ